MIMDFLLNQTGMKYKEDFTTNNQEKMNIIMCY